MEYSSNDVKQLFRSVYTLVKGQDEQKATLTVDGILQPSFQLSHRLLVSQCIQLLFEDFESVGQKSREILWRKGYYDVICLLKRQKGRTDSAALLNATDCLIREGITYFKAIVLRFAQMFNLDYLHHVVDFGLLEDYDEETLRTASCYSLLQLQNAEEMAVKELYTNQEIKYALETIHSLLISLGDLNRYLFEFGIGNRVEMRDQTRRYYLEAFKLNPRIGMAQNQLGMLMSGQNSHLDAVYHYLYSLCCAIPFECSETNVNLIFQKNIRHLESGGDMGGGIVEGDDRSVEDFIATFLLVVDVFFYDKVVTDFTALCHSVLMDFKKIMSIQLLLDDYYLTDDMIFKIVSILFFCMHRIKALKSDKIYSLNAFLVGLCSELLQWCTTSFEKFANDHGREDARFQEHYLRRYQQYDEQVHRARELVKHGSAMFSKDQKSSSGVEEGTGSQDSRGTSSKENDAENVMKTENAKSVVGDGAMKSHTVNRHKKSSRRRRRAYSNETDSEEDEIYGNDREEDDEGESEDDYCNQSDSESSSEAEEEEHDDEDIMSLYSYGSYDEYSGEEDEVGAGQDRSDDEDQKGNGSDEEKSAVCGAANNEPVTEQLKFKKRYPKLDPNIVLEFAMGERTLRSLKILFDWLLCNMDVLHSCYQSNPEFLHNIMKLLNHFNVDIFTNRFYFTRDLIVVPGLRENLHEIFNSRRTIPLQEDVAMKRFREFDLTQESLLWELPYKMAISKEDESFLRLMKLVDFGFTVSKSKKFDYCFLPKVRAFKVRAVLGGTGRSNPTVKGQRNGKQKRKGDAPGKVTTAKRDWTNGGGDGVHRNRGISYSQSRNGRVQQGSGVEGAGRNRPLTAEHDRHRRGYACTEDEQNDVLLLSRDSKHKRNRQRNKGQQGAVGPGQEKYDTGSAPTLFTKKGYLHNRGNGMMLKRNARNEYEGANFVEDEMQRDKQDSQERGDISALMGKLWLRNEVETLESKVNKRAVNVILTPYLVVDSKCLTEYTSIVKNLIKTKKFVILVPIVVLGDLDELKKHSEGARNAIKWLEVEFSKGNRFLRAQKAHEALQIPLVKIPKKLDRDGAVFSQIVQFCNHIVTNHADRDADIITYLSGDSLHDKKLPNGSCYMGILEAIPVKFEQIVTFYSSYKRK